MSREEAIVRIEKEDPVTEARRFGESGQSDVMETNGRSFKQIQ